MQLINTPLLDNLTLQAQESPRGRMNLNFHDSLDAPAQRLLNALQIGTDIPIHRHRHTAETYILLRGRLRVMYFNDNKEVVSETILDPSEGNHGVHIPANQWHGVEVLAPDSIIFEVKDGPYFPLGNEDILR